ncbi:energy transducer TonB [Shewanella sp. Choline-02u-19]|uniref:energy transducer TonB n=1 Tax=unclassified Shewanella TaxID=196818 RepID=UPI000C33C3AD|nr:MULTISPECIES: energy transducer TonB [unclassified Shewanella]PKH56750.1 energy transducer TonB [Shewanella sp. Bg11-22]PKI30301.1 energy transducer TonB [Shewanella sp. Choline-02u-19]
MTPKRYFAFGCLTLLIQGGVLASQNSEATIQLSSGSAMGSNQAVNLSIAMQASQAPASETAKPKAKAVKKLEPKPVVKTAAKPIAKITAKRKPVAKQPPTEPPKKLASKGEKVVEKQPKKQSSQQRAHDQVQAEAKQGVSKQSVALNQPTFAAPPTQPHYPKKARQRGFQGTATIEVMFNQVGEQMSLTLVDSSGYRLLDKAALNAVEKWQFSAPSPQTAYAYTVRVPVKFELN